MVQNDWIVQIQGDADGRLLTLLLVLRKINHAFRLLYKGGVWLPSASAREIGEAGLCALRGIGKLAKDSLALDQQRFALYSKYHMMLHLFYTLVWNADKAAWVESPMTDCCQQCEAFIGQVARMSRRVSAKATIDRSMDVYLLAIRQHWDDMDH